MQKNQIKKIDYKILAVVGIASFMAIFVTTGMILTSVYGYDFNNSIAYNETMNKTQEAANYTEGMEIDLYIKNIENQTLGGVQ